MRNRFRIPWAVLSALALTLLGTGGATAQTQTMKTDVLAFEVISVDGNNLVVRDQNGTRALTVPEDFRFTVDGKPMSVHELTRGMKGTATVTTTTTVRPVYVTEVKRVWSWIRLAIPSASVPRRVSAASRRASSTSAVSGYHDGKPTRVPGAAERRPVVGNHRHVRPAGGSYGEAGAGCTRCYTCRGGTRGRGARRRHHRPPRHRQPPR